MKARAVATLGILTAVALILGYLEQLVALSPVPGVKLGLSNTVLLYALYLLDARSAWLLMALKVTLTSLLFSGPFALLFSLAGGVASLAAMSLLRRVRDVGIVGVSVVGAAVHNLAQLVVAAFLVETRATLSLLPILLLSALAAGVVTGAIAKTVFPLLKPRSSAAQASQDSARAPGESAPQEHSEQPNDTEVHKS